MVGAVQYKGVGGCNTSTPSANAMPFTAELALAQDHTAGLSSARERFQKWIQGMPAVADYVYVFIKYGESDIVLVEGKVVSFGEGRLKVAITYWDIVNALGFATSQDRSHSRISAYVRNRSLTRDAKPPTQEFTYRNIVLRNGHYCTTDANGKNPLFVGFQSKAGAIAAAKVESPRIQAKDVSTVIDELKAAADKWYQDHRTYLAANEIPTQVGNAAIQHWLRISATAGL